MERPRIPDYQKEKLFDSEYVFDLNRYIEWLEKQNKIYFLMSCDPPGLAYCGCIDRCSSKRREYYCRAKRFCHHKVTIVNEQK